MAKTSRVTFRMSPERRRSVEGMADRMGISISAYLRAAHGAVSSAVEEHRIAEEARKRTSRALARKLSQGDAQDHC